MMTANGLAKLVEELGELQQVAGKMIAYGTGGHPDGGPPLLRRFEEEAGDVLGAIDFVIVALAASDTAIRDRAERKLALFMKWDADPNEPELLGQQGKGGEG